MVDQLRSWFRENQTLVMFLGAQLVALGAGAAAILAYSVKLETKVSIMETRGAEYTVERLSRIDQRLAVIEQRQQKNEASIDRIINEFLKDKRP